MSSLRHSLLNVQLDIVKVSMEPFSIRRMYMYKYKYMTWHVSLNELVNSLCRYLIVDFPVYCKRLYIKLLTQNVNSHVVGSEFLHGPNDSVSVHVTRISKRLQNNRQESFLEDPASCWQSSNLSRWLSYFIACLSCGLSSSN